MHLYHWSSWTVYVLEIGDLRKFISKMLKVPLLNIVSLATEDGSVLHSLHVVVNSINDIPLPWVLTIITVQ